MLSMLRIGIYALILSLLTKGLQLILIQYLLNFIQAIV